MQTLSSPTECISGSLEKILYSYDCINKKAWGNYMKSSVRKYRGKARFQKWKLFLQITAVHLNIKAYTLKSNILVYVNIS